MSKEECKALLPRITTENRTMSTTAMQPTPSTYSEARDILGSRSSRKIAHNTRLVQIDAESLIGVQLHSTYVVRFYYDGMMRLDSGGWQTVTTKERINRYLPADVGLFAKARVWYVNDRRFGGDVTVEYSDGMLVRPDSVVVEA